MKYVFLVNSHTTFLTSIGVVNKLDIPSSDVIFFFHRNYENKFFDINKYRVANFDDLYTEFINTDISSIKSSIKTFIKKTDLFLNEHVNDYFRLYTPHLGNLLYRAVYSNKKCTEVAFIQEGAVVFKTAYENTIPLWKRCFRKMKDFVRYKTTRVWSGNFYEDGYLRHGQNKLLSYSVDNKIFQFLSSNNTLVEWPRINVDCNIEKGAMIFILDGFVKNNMCESEIYLRNVKRLIKEYGHNNNYLKFHPNESPKERETIISYFHEAGLKSELLSDNVPFELIISSVPNLNIVGLGSSLLFFAKGLDHSVICHDDWLFESSVLFQNYKKSKSFLLFKEIYN